MEGFSHADGMMLERIKKIIGLKSDTAAPLGELPPIEKSETAAPPPVIDTGSIPSDGVVTRILEVQTDGEKTDSLRLRMRFIGRQPILDRQQQVVGYELKLRHGSTRGQDESVRRLYDEMLLQCIVDLNVERLLGDKLVLVSLTVASLSSTLLQRLPGKGIVLAVQGSPEELVGAQHLLADLVSQGYQIALEDFVYSKESAPLLKGVHYVRVRVSRFDAIELGKQVVGILKDHNPKLMAVEVETEEDFEVCRKLSFNFFEGHFFNGPRQFTGQKVDSDRVLVMEILNRVMARAELSELEEMFKHDAMLSYKLLRYINSAGSGVGQEIRSIAHGLFILGYEQLYRWLTLLLFTSGKVDERQRSVLKTALVRARLTEVLGLPFIGHPQNEGLFIVGIFSLLDRLLNVPMEKALSHLHLPEAILDALLRHEGIYAPYLALAAACEDFDQERIEALAEQCGLSAETVNEAHVQALVGAEEIER